MKKLFSSFLRFIFSVSDSSKPLTLHITLQFCKCKQAFSDLQILLMMSRSICGKTSGTFTGKTLVKV